MAVFESGISGELGSLVTNFESSLLAALAMIGKGEPLEDEKRDSLGAGLSEWLTLEDVNSF